MCCTYCQIRVQTVCYKIYVELHTTTKFQKYTEIHKARLEKTHSNWISSYKALYVRWWTFVDIISMYCPRKKNVMDALLKPLTQRSKFWMCGILRFETKFDIITRVCRHTRVITIPSSCVCSSFQHVPNHQNMSMCTWMHEMPYLYARLSVSLHGMPITKWMRYKKGNWKSLFTRAWTEIVSNQ